MDGSVDSLLRPRSIAVVGASQRPDSFGRIVLDGLVAGDHRGRIIPIHPTGRDGAGFEVGAFLQHDAPVDNDQLDGAFIVRSLDEVSDTLESVTDDRHPSGRSLALATDSGGKRALICDIATVARLHKVLDPEPVIAAVDFSPLVVGPWGVIAVVATVITRNVSGENPTADYLSLGDG